MFIMYENIKKKFSLKNISILYVNDDEKSKEIILKNLKKSISKIKTASSKKEAYKKFLKHKFELVIISLLHNQIDGIKLLRKIRKSDSEIHAIILLENSSEEFCSILSDTNILNHYISKTQNLEVLNRYIKKSIKKTIKRRNFKQTHALLEQYKVALDESWLVMKINLTGQITYVNQNFCKTSGYKEAEIIGKNITLLRQASKNDTLLLDLWKTITSKKVFKSEIKHIKKNGSFFYVNTTIIPVINTYNEVLEYISISFDITQLKSELKKSEEARRAKSAFLAAMSHDIRTPLNGILGFSRLLQNQNLEKSIQSSYIETINKSSLSLLGTINEILDISKIENGKLELENQYFNCALEFEIVVELFSSLANEKNIDYVFYLDPKLPKKLFGDVLRIKQILTNLISNAIKFTPIDGEICVDIKVLELTDVCKYSISVKDNGIGIDKNSQESIFKPFEQANKRIASKFGGTGLGLSISHNVLTLMNSAIKLQSAPNKGSTFSFILESAYENEKTKYSKELSEFEVLLYTKDKKHVSKQIELTRTYMNIFTQTSVDDNIKEIANFDVCVILFDDFKQYTQESFVIPTVIIHKTNIGTINIKSPYVTLKTPIYLDKTYVSLLGLLNIKNTDVGEIQKKLADDDTMFTGNVLVAEDDETSQQLIQIILESRGVNVKMVEDGDKAIEYVTQMHQDNSLDFILMDINMPYKNGIDATYEIKEYEKSNKMKHTPIIALTANAITGDKEKYINLGMDDYLSKPIKYPELFDVLDEYLLKTKHSLKQKDEISNSFKNSLSYSLEDSAKVVGISTEKFTTIFEKFVNTFDDKLSVLKKYIKDDNIEELSNTAHSLKGASGNMNITQMYELFKSIEHSSKTNMHSSYENELKQIQEIHLQLQEILKNSKTS